MKITILAALAAFALVGCDAVRVPGQSANTDPIVMPTPPQDMPTDPVIPAAMSDDDRQAIVNACIDAGENAKYCDCTALAARDHASPALQATLITAARAFTTPDLPEDLITNAIHTDYVTASLMCESLTNAEKAITFCETGGNDRSLCACQINQFTRNLDATAFAAFVNSLGTDEKFDETVADWGEPYVTQWATAQTEAATCVSSE